MAGESTLQKQIMLEAALRGWLAFKVSGARGLPDLILIDPDGLTHYCEVKTPTGGGRLSGLQHLTLAAIAKQNSPVVVLSSLEKALRYFNARTK